MMLQTVGPKDRWQVEMERASKSGLMDLIDRLTYVYGAGRDELLAMAKSARSAGRYLDARAALARLQADTRGECERLARKSIAAKKAARRRARRKKVA